jgi:hypothetical protein
MKFDWKLFGLQRKLDWDLEQARGRLGQQLGEALELGGTLRALETSHAEQSAAALAAARRRTDPVAHGQALAYLAGMEARLARARFQRTQLDAKVEALRAECQHCNERREVLAALYDRGFSRYMHARQREAEKEADFAWLARAADADCPVRGFTQT